MFRGGATLEGLYRPPALPLGLSVLLLLARGWKDHNRRETRAAKSSEDAAGANFQPAAPGAAASNHSKMMSAGLALRCCDALPRCMRRVAHWFLHVCSVGALCTLCTQYTQVSLVWVYI